MRTALPILFSVLMLHSAGSPLFATHPLITDDTATQGTGRTQLEIDGQRDYRHRGGVRETTVQLQPLVSHGIRETVDLIAGVPYASQKTDESGETVRENGISDLMLQLKWRFYEKDNVSFALRPGVTLPTGDDRGGFGAGKVTYNLFFIMTRRLEPWAFHLNIAYYLNENTQDERRGIWHISLASEYGATEKLRVVANAGIEKERDPGSHDNPAFVLGGLIYALTNNVDIDVGYKYGLTSSEVQSSVLAGVTWRF